MEEKTNRNVEVLRLGHRPERDARLTTHVCLTARAFGADAVHVDGNDKRPVETARDITRRFGGDFEARSVESPRSVVNDFDGTVVHLTMYGEPVQDVVDEVRDADEPVLALVGAGKVDGWVYGEADYNVGVTNQPHSEVAALAVFLHEYFDSDELDASFEGGEIEVVPSESGKETRSL
ncbi:MAG: tRNA (cytidine(56)-2'-O)-methyltransferase [Halobacteriales archaeon]|nr:tRNA (cytidine(56)-2'-O)-methyltransferase [Halobacteriales archaeon]